MEEMDTAIIAASACSEESRLPGRESDGFHGGIKSKDMFFLTWTDT